MTTQEQIKQAIRDLLGELRQTQKHLHATAAAAPTMSEWRSFQLLADLRPAGILAEELREKIEEALEFKREGEAPDNDETNDEHASGEPGGDASDGELEF